jgi:ligand-binding sensor domain-containing protein
MHQKRFSILLFSILVLASLTRLEAQSKNTSPILYSLTEQNGLSDNVTTCFYQDSRGFMWIGTEDGLNLYDGSAITVFKKSPDHPRAIADNKINEIAEDSQHAIWIATANGLSRYDPNTTSIRSWKLGGVTNLRDFNYIKSLIPWKGGQIWLGTAAGLVLFDPIKNRFEALPVVVQKTGMNNYANNAISKLLLDREDRFWLATYNGLWRFFPADNHFEQYLSKHELEPADELIINFLEDHEGKLWVSVWNGGVKLFDPDIKSIQDFDAFNHLRNNVSGMAEIRDPKGNYHLFFSPQLVEFSRKSNSLFNDLTLLKENKQTIKISYL